MQVAGPRHARGARRGAAPRPRPARRCASAAAAPSRAGRRPRRRSVELSTAAPRRDRRAQRGDLTAVLEPGCASLRAGAVRQGRAAPRARPAGRRSDDRRVVRRHRPAARSLRRPARPGGGNASGALERHARQERRQGDQERGYDIAKLFTGSFGTLGAIVELSVRLHLLPPRPRQLGESAAGRARARRRRSAGSALEHHGLDVSWRGGRGRSWRASAGAAPAGPRPPSSSCGEGLSTEILDDDTPAWDEQRGAARTARGQGVGLATAPARPAAGGGEAGASLVAARRSGSPRCRCPPPRSSVCGATGSQRCRTGRPASVRSVGGMDPAARADAAGEGALRCRAVPAATTRPRAPQPRPDRRLRALRLLPAHLPDLRALGRGDGLAARADSADEGRPRGDRPAPDPPRPLPRLHGVRDRVPVRGAVRQADRGRPPAARAQRGAPARARTGGSSSSCSRGRGGCGRWRPGRPSHRGWVSPGSPRRPRAPARASPRGDGRDDPETSMRRSLSRLPTRFRGARRAARHGGALQGCVQRVLLRM